MGDLAAYGSLVGVAFVAATILPAGSEAVLAGLVLTGRYPVSTLIAVATVGNVLGSVTNWVLGRFMARLEGRRWFPLTPVQVARAEGWYHRWGKWSLLLSWAPVIGDPLTIVAGVLREPLPVFVLLVTVAKLGRYVVVAWLAQSFA